jgi:hypothetical protein
MKYNELVYLDLIIIFFTFRAVLKSRGIFLNCEQEFLLEPLKFNGILES